MLSPEIRQACPPSPKVDDGSPIAIASADVELALEYRKCAAKHDGAVSAFDAMAAAYQQLRDAITARIKGGKNVK